MNARELAMREPALAILMGAMSGGPAGPQFGNDWGYGNQYGFGLQPGVQTPGPWAANPQLSYGFGVSPPGAPHPMQHGPAAPGAHPAYGIHPALPGGWGPMAHTQQSHAMAMAHGPAAYHQSIATAMHNPGSTEARSFLLDPNRDSTIKVERYSFSFSPNTNLVLGTASGIVNFSKNPSTSVKIDRVITNAPNPGFVLLSQLQIANVNVFVGSTEDAWTYNPLGQNVLVETPRLDPQNSATSAGSYTGMLPAGFAGGTSFQFVLTLQGASTMAGGFGQ